MKTNNGCFLLLFLLMLPLISSNQEDIYNLNYLTKTNIKGSFLIHPNECNSQINFIKIQGTAENLKVTNSKELNISYEKYSIDEIGKLQSKLSNCQNLNEMEEIFPDKNHNTLLLGEIPNCDLIEIYLEYDIKNEQKNSGAGIFKNYLNLQGYKEGKIVIIFPKEARIWYDSFEPEEITEENQTIIATWNNLKRDSLFVTFGTSSEYLIYEENKSSLLNNYTTLQLFLVTLITSFILYLTPEEKKIKIKSLTKYYYLFFILLFILFYIISLFSTNLEPFHKTFTIEILIYTIVLACIFPSFYIIENKLNENKSKLK